MIAGLGLIITLLAGLGALISNNNHRIVEGVIFPAVMLITATVYALFFPISTVPDEGYHFMHAYTYANYVYPGRELDNIRVVDLAFLEDESLSGGEIINGRLNPSTVDDVRWDALVEKNVLVTDNHGETKYEDLQWAINLSTDLPQVRLPAAAGIILARAVGLGPIPLFYLGRLFTLIYSAILIIAAVKITPIGKNPMMATALLPITLQQLASYSYDGPIIGLSFLYFALIMRICARESYLSAAEGAGLFLVGALLAPCKVVYSALLLLALFIPKKRFTSRAHEIAFKASAIVLPFAVGLLMRQAQINSLTGVQYLERPTGLPQNRRWNANLNEYEYGTFYSLIDFVDNPLQFVYIMGNSLISSMGLYVGSAVGSLLGNMEASIALPHYMWIPLVLILALTIFGDSYDNLYPSMVQRGIFVLVSVLVVSATMAAMLFGYTFSGETIIKGVQGRYFLQIMPFLLLAFRPQRPRFPIALDASLCIILSSASFVVLNYIATVIIMTN
ncbi:MAG: DUF2142 domain-containing protein [Atopobiaceae bacterium]|nr:DUF2142 domain-containing protein [Atopobiaceae bacterium]